MLLRSKTSFYWTFAGLFFSVNLLLLKPYEAQAAVTDKFMQKTVNQMSQDRLKCADLLSTTLVPTDNVEKACEQEDSCAAKVDLLTWNGLKQFEKEMDLILPKQQYPTFFLVEQNPEVLLKGLLNNKRREFSLAVILQIKKEAVAEQDNGKFASVQAMAARRFLKKFQDLVSNTEVGHADQLMLSNLLNVISYEVRNARKEDPGILSSVRLDKRDELSDAQLRRMGVQFASEIHDSLARTGIPGLASVYKKYLLYLDLFGEDRDLLPYNSESRMFKLLGKINTRAVQMVHHMYFLELAFSEDSSPDLKAYLRDYLTYVLEVQLPLILSKQRPFDRLGRFGGEDARPIAVDFLLKLKEKYQALIKKEN